MPITALLATHQDRDAGRRVLPEYVVFRLNVDSLQTALCTLRLQFKGKTVLKRYAGHEDLKITKLQIYTVGSICSREMHNGKFSRSSFDLANL